MLFGLEQGTGWLHALGMAIVHSFWQSLLLWGIYQFIFFIRKKASSAERHNLAIASVLGAFTWFSITFITGWQQQEIANEWLSINSGAIATAPAHGTIHWGAWVPYLSLSYLILLVFFLIRLCHTYISSKKILYKELRPAPVGFQMFLDNARKHFGVGKKVTLWLSGHISVPGTIGFIKPIILMPVAALNQLSQEQLEAILLHELSHIRRNDYIINLLLSIIEIILFFNPFIHLWMKAIKRERENCCDDFVLQQSYDSVSYARALVQLANLKPTAHPMAMGAVSGNRQLLHRVVRITGGQLKMHQYRYKIIALVVTMGILISFSYMAFTFKTTKDHQHVMTSNSDFKKESIHESLAFNTDQNPEPKIQEKEQPNHLPGNESNERTNTAPGDSETQPGSISEEKIPEQWEKLMPDARFSDQLNLALQQAQGAMQNINWESISREVHTALEEIDWESINREINEAGIGTNIWKDSTRQLKLSELLSKLQQVQHTQQIEKQLKDKQLLLKNIQTNIEKVQMNRAKEFSRNENKLMESYYGFRNTTAPQGVTNIQRFNPSHSIGLFHRGTENDYKFRPLPIQLDSLVHSNLLRVPHGEKIVVKILRKMDI